MAPASAVGRAVGRTHARIAAPTGSRMTTRAMLVRPYTVRKGDTVFKISQKRGAFCERTRAVFVPMRHRGATCADDDAI